MFLTRFDLETTLNIADMQILAENDSDYLIAHEKAISIIKSYIQHRYDPDEIFITVNNYNVATTYAIGDLVFYINKYYTCTAVSTGNVPTHTNYFTESDSRDPSIVDICCVLTIFLLFRKVQPRNIPEWIMEDYDRVIEALKAYQKGTRTILLTVSTNADGEEEGHRISYGTETQKDWEI